MWDLGVQSQQNQIKLCWHECQGAQVVPLLVEGQERERAIACADLYPTFCHDLLEDNLKSESINFMLLCLQVCNAQGCHM